jgi:hypothetical protein
MSNFDLARLAIDPGFDLYGRPAVYRPPERDRETPCTIMFNAPDATLAGPVNTRTFAPAIVIEVRKSEIAQPKRNGIFAMAESPEEFKIASDPKCEDPERLIWSMTVTPA